MNKTEMKDLDVAGAFEGMTHKQKAIIQIFAGEPGMPFDIHFHHCLEVAIGGVVLKEELSDPEMLKFFKHELLK